MPDAKGRMGSVLFLTLAPLPEFTRKYVAIAKIERNYLPTYLEVASLWDSKKLGFTKPCELRLTGVLAPEILEKEKEKEKEKGKKGKGKKKGLFGRVFGKKN